MLEKRKDNCMVGRHKFIFSPPFSVQEAQLGGISPTGHAREGLLLLGKAQGQSRMTLMPSFARMRRRQAVLPPPSARRSRHSVAVGCRLQLQIDHHTSQIHLPAPPDLIFASRSGLPLTGG
jgi:hypothetical protein